MSILARRAQKALQPPGYAVLEMLTKEATDILEELADHWDFTSLKGETGNESDAMKNRMETVIRTARKLGL